MAKNRKKSKPSGVGLSDEISVTFGKFKVGEHCVPYMHANLTFSQIANNLNLVTDNPKYVKHDWSIQELFQRDVNLDRVDTLAHQYLKNDTQHPPFFNSLTIVLNVDGEEEISPNVPLDDTWHKENRNIPGFVLAWENDSEEEIENPEDGTNFPKSSEANGVIRWNKKNVNAVAIDGQHRLAAIKELNRKSPTSDIMTNCYGSLIILLFDKRIGFNWDKNPVVDSRLSKKAMRKIFIDLNKHAVPVSKARNILLDDWDPKACFIRSLMGETLKYTPTTIKSLAGHNIGENDEFLSCVPLNLVDWHSEGGSKIDSGPYLASILSLAWMFEKVSCLKSPAAYWDPDDDGTPAKLQKQFGLYETTRHKHALDEIFKKENKDGWKNFKLNRDILDSLVTEFKEGHGRAITHILTGLTSYKELIKARLDANSLTPEYAQLYQLYQSVDDAVKKKTKTREAKFGSAIEQAEEEIKEDNKKRKAKDNIDLDTYKGLHKKIEVKQKDNNFLYYLVAQRAVFYAYDEIYKYWAEEIEQCSQIIGSLWKEDSVSELICADFLVQALNNIGSKTKTLFQKSLVPGDKKVESYRKESTTFINKTGEEEGKEEVNSTHINNTRPEFWAASFLDRNDGVKIDESDKASKRGADWICFIVYAYWGFQELKKSNAKLKFLKYIKEIETHKDKDKLHEKVSELYNKLIHYDNPAEFAIRAASGEDWQEDLEATYKAWVFERIILLNTMIS
jgi:hypothetical protein